MILAIHACKIRWSKQLISVFNWIKLCSSLPCAEQKLSRRAERERSVHTRWTETEQTRREREIRAHALNRNWADAERERERDACTRAEQKLSRRREREMRARAEQKLSRRGERERCVHTRWTETEQTDRCVCVCWESKISHGNTGDSRRLNKVWALFFFREKTLKGSAMLLSWQHCASPFLQLRVGPQVKQKIHAALIKLVPLKGICVNALLTLLTLTALILALIHLPNNNCN